MGGKRARHPTHNRMVPPPDRGTANFPWRSSGSSYPPVCTRLRLAFQATGTNTGQGVRWPDALVEASGIEPPTPGLQSRCSPKLSYAPGLTAGRFGEVRTGRWFIQTGRAAVKEGFAPVLPGGAVAPRRGQYSQPWSSPIRVRVFTRSSRSGQRGLGAITPSPAATAPRAMMTLPAS